ncbi:MAG: hypothetical protein ACOYOU_03340 [Kiritimatiellia bacterium]
MAQIDPASMHRFIAGMESLNAALGKRQKSIVEIAAVKLVVALGSADATATAKPRREIVENPEWFMARNDAVMAGKSNSAATRYAKKIRTPHWAVRFDYKCPAGGFKLSGGGGLMPIRLGQNDLGAETKAQARNHPLAQIKKLGAGGYRGIARRSWAWTLKVFGKSSANETPGAVSSSWEQSKRGNGFDAVWTGINRISYERKALKRPISKSVDAATNMMLQQASREIIKARGESGFR